LKNCPGRRILAAKMKKLSAKEDFAWERRSQAPGFFPKLGDIYYKDPLMKERTRKNRRIIRLS